jgi:protein-disulfide isomerase
LNQYGDRVAFVYKDFPLSGHNWAVHAAVDANCLGAQSYEAYWDFADRIHSHQETVNSEKGPDKQFAALDRTTLSEGSRFKLDTAKLESCVKAQEDDAVRASLKEGESVGVKGTPTLFVNGQKLVGDHPISEFRAAFDSALKDAGVPPPTSSRTPAASAGVPEPSAGERSQVRQ